MRCRFGSGSCWSASLSGNQSYTFLCSYHAVELSLLGLYKLLFISSFLLFSSSPHHPDLSNGSNTTRPTLSIGVLLLEKHELLDSTGPIDLLTNISYDFLRHLPHTETFLPLAPRLTWHYISHSLSPTSATGGPQLLPTTTYTTCPPLDVLIIPGPDPLAPLLDDVKEFIVARVEEVQAVLAVCSGSIALAKTGVLAGKRAMSDKVLLKAMGRDNAFGVHWVPKGRWMREGNIWTCGGVMAGMDMTAAWMLDNFDNALVKWSFEVAEFEPKGGGWNGFDYLAGEV